MGTSLVLYLCQFLGDEFGIVAFDTIQFDEIEGGLFRLDYLTMEEISAIYNKKFTSKRLEQVRDLFIFSCYTVLSYIDVCELTQENIRTSFDGNLWIMTKRHKTNVASNI